MSDDLFYLDSSALVKLVVHEAESDALTAFLEDRPLRISSRLARVEVIRAVRRSSPEPVIHDRVQAVLETIHFLTIDNDILDHAAWLEPEGLRSLDAIHLASALFLGTDLSGFIVYDRQLATAASHAGLQVHAPR